MRRGTNAILIALGVAGLASGVGAFWVTRHGALRAPEIPSAPVAVLVGWSFVGSGLLSWRAVRLVRASHPQRRAVIPVLLAGMVALTALAASLGADALGAPNRDVYNRVAGYAFAVVPVAVLVAFLQRRLARGAVAGLVVELGEPRTAVGLAEALSRALGDPSLSVGYWSAPPPG